MNVTRRRFLATAGAACAAGLTGGWFEARRVGLTRHELGVPGLPAALDGLRIAHLTDTHLPGNITAVRAAVELVRRERPEVTVLTGDVTESPAALGMVTDLTAGVLGSLATVAVFGNWERRHGVEPADAAAAYRRAGAELLVNARRTVTVAGERLELVGLDDPVRGHPDIAAARAGLEAGGTEVWLVHAPGFADLRPPGVSTPPALILSGHTHGGQVRLPLLPAVTPRGSGRFVAGWYRDAFGPLFVSRGVGTADLPVRLRCPAEVAVITLCRERT